MALSSKEKHTVLELVRTIVRVGHLFYMLDGFKENKKYEEIIKHREKLNEAKLKVDVLCKELGINQRHIYL